jgi:hypothetical protein
MTVFFEWAASTPECLLLVFLRLPRRFPGILIPLQLHSLEKEFQL